MKRPETAEFLVEKLEQDRDRTLGFFGSIARGDWELAVYTEGAAWKVREVLAHLAAAEDAVARLIAHVVQGGGGVPADFDLDGYNERKVAELIGRSPGELMEHFGEHRAGTIAQVRPYGERELDLRGRHPFLGEAAVRDMIKLMYRHTQIHQRDLRRALRAEAREDAA